MHPRYLRTFIAAATTLNFTRAALAVHLAPSSVSEQMQALEAELGTPLFDRSRRKVRLTAAGEVLLTYARELIDLSDEARTSVATASRGDRGTLTIGVLETLASHWLPQVLAEFHRDHPGIALSLQVAGSGELKAAVRGGTLDVCFAFNTKPDLDLIVRTLDHTRMVAIVPSDHRCAEMDRLARPDLATEAFIVSQKGCVYRHLSQEVPDARGFPAVPPQPTMESRAYGRGSRSK
ncbi:LysR family transcriptional regulator [Sphingomonas sp. UYP23]